MGGAEEGEVEETSAFTVVKRDTLQEIAQKTMCHSQAPDLHHLRHLETLFQSISTRTFTLITFFRNPGVRTLGSFRGTIPSQITTKVALVSYKKSNFRGFIYSFTLAIYCDSAAFSPSLATWQEQLAENNVYGAFGMHPHNAKYYNDQV